MASFDVGEAAAVLGLGVERTEELTALAVGWAELGVEQQEAWFGPLAGRACVERGAALAEGACGGVLVFADAEEVPGSS